MIDRSRAPLPEKIRAIQRCGFVRWAGGSAAPDLAKRFDARIPVAGVRHIRVWGLQVDDERTLPGRERTSIPDEEVWEVNLEALDGSHYEVSADLVEPDLE